MHVLHKKTIERIDLLFAMKATLCLPYPHSVIKRLHLPNHFTRYPFLKLWILLFFSDFCRAMLCISTAIAVMRCPSVRPPVTFVDHVKTNKDVLEFFSPSGSHTILVFPYQTGWRYSDGNPPNGDVECRWGIGRNRDSGLIAGCR